MTSPRLEAAANSTRTEAEVRAARVPAKAAHTPGPWVVGGKDNITVYTSGHRGTYHHRTADCPYWSDRDLGPTKAQAQANARLIAASPDLLAALQAIILESDKLPEDQFRMAAAAIAKATGQ